jgi:hypothetical protein
MAKTGDDGVAKIKQPAPETVQAFREKLTASQKTAFDALGRLVAAPRADLGWRHTIGRRIVRLIQDEGHHGLGWFDLLSEALGPSPSMLRKAARFAALYPSEASLQVLEEMRVDWTLLELTFSVGDEDKRHQLLQQAVNEGWSGQDLRFEVQRRFPSRRGGVGGRPRRPLSAHGPEVTLRELTRWNRRWDDFYADAFSGIKAKDWKAFARRCTRTGGEDLRELAQEAAVSLTGLAKHCAEARRRIRKWLRGLPKAE